MVPGAAAVYMDSREFEITVWLRRGYDGWDLAPIREAVAEAVGLSADQVITKLSDPFCLVWEVPWQAWWRPL